MTIRRSIFCLTLLSFSQLFSFAQLDRFVYNIEGPDGNINTNELIRLTHLRADSNLILLSEERHDYRSLDLARTHFLLGLASNLKADLIFDEWPMVDYKFMLDRLHMAVIADSFLKSNAGSYSMYLADDLKIMLNSGYYNFMKTLDGDGLLDKVIPIDIGTNSYYVGLFYFADYTKYLNLERDPIIDNFCDSIKKKYSLDYLGTPELFNDDVTVYENKNSSIHLFLSALAGKDKYKNVRNTWENIFAGYFQSKYFSDLFPDKKELRKDDKDFVKGNSFRDSILYNNFNFYSQSGQSWRNIIVLFSSFHLLDTRNHVVFPDFGDSSVHTLGRYFHSRYKNIITHIVFVCNSGSGTCRETNNSNYKRSLEYRLASKYNAAYVDLRAYRDSVLERRPFYLRPTLTRFRKANWENIIDGIIFIKDCGCDSPAKFLKKGGS